MGAVVLARSLHAVGNLPDGTDLVCIAPTESELQGDAEHGISPRTELLLEHAGWELRRRTLRDGLHLKQPLWASRNFTVGAPLKLHAWALTEYERVLFIDADSIVLRSLAPLLLEDRYWRGAVTSSFEVCQDDFITAMMGASPSDSTFARLTEPSSLQTYVHDQQYLNERFADEWRAKPLSERFPQLARVGAAHCAVGQPLRSKADRCLQRQLAMGEKYALVFDFQGASKPWAWPERHVAGCQRMDQYAMLWVTVLAAMSLDDVGTALRGFSPGRDNQPLLGPLIARAASAVTTPPAADAVASFAPAALKMLPALLALGQVPLVARNHDGALAPPSPGVPPDAEDGWQPRRALPSLISEGHARWLSDHPASRAQAVRIHALGAKVSTGDMADIADEARALARELPTDAGALSIAAAVEGKAGRHSMAAAHLEDVLVQLQGGMQRERARLALVRSLLSQDRPALASAQVHLAVTAAAGLPRLSLEARELLDSLPDRLEKAHRERVGHGGGGSAPDGEDRAAAAEEEAAQWRRQAEARRDLNECRVVAVPMGGFGNRMRLMASASAYAEQHGCAFFVHWQTDDAMPVRWEHIFGLAALEPLFAFEAPTHADRPAFNAWLAAIEPRAVDTVAIVGAHHFVPPGMGFEEFNRRKRSFYTALLSLSPASASRKLMGTRGHACVHHRAYVAEHDAADFRGGQPQPFDREPAVQIFVDHLEEVAPSMPVFVASTSADFKEALRAALPDRHVVWHQPSRRPSTRAGFLADWLALARCDVLVATGGSSFSDEAVHLHGITKHCVPAQPDASYHVLSRVERGRRYVDGAERGWHSV